MDAISAASLSFPPLWCGDWLLPSSRDGPMRDAL
jgi:hypothetical protein